MSSEWPTVRLGDYVDACLGKMLDVKKNKGIPQVYLGNSNVRWGRFDLENLAEMKFESHEEERYSLFPGDLVVCEGGEPGRCAIWNGPAGMKIQKALHRIRPKKDLNNYYLFYWFNYAAGSGKLEPFFTGTTIKHLTGKAISELLIPLPPLPQQLSMVGILKKLDDRITLLRETNATLEAIAQALFKSWFVDFDPVHANAHARAQNQNSHPQAAQPNPAPHTAKAIAQNLGLDAATAALFPDHFQDSDLGHIPAGWSVESIYEIADLIYGAPFSSKLFNTEGKGRPLVRIRDLKSETPGVYTEEIHPKGHLIEPGEIVVGMDGEFRAYLWGGERAWLNQRVCIFSPKENVPSAFLRNVITPLLAEVEATEIATTVIHLGKNDIDRFKFISPPQELLIEFGKRINPLYQQVVNNKLMSSNLTQLRDTLLPRLISGQLRLPEAEAQIEAVVGGA